MAILDSKGRLFGKLSLLDLGAALAILMVVFGIFFYPGATGSVAQVNAKTQEIEVDVIARGLTVLNPETFLSDLAKTKSTKIIVRNQPYGQIGVKKVQALPRSVAVPQPDGTVKSYPDPRPELSYTADMLITLGGKAQITDDGPVLGVPIKIGTPIEIEGQSYHFNVSTVAVRVLN
ncbi:MAG: pyruvate/2-oxoglutarate dehydrogenase complex,dihydrolipoamide dehydrogenase (E3) component [Phormidesmis priestleyi]|uniref:Pyruvate/2-oxoglutarate dehydrogenase complex,dihydrolipoamide dehydrogenase (E3) component n=1 Tax=Phormidesmis priestleyi TaxID=268141 RepID=A0A2W4XJI6_9CYAN|nr:MAG: pyruvate/2-oxoglutarate dehydrogenase complex,dihydrolipoamide dehydrogenase (E3) component [Phormidesmis priestleyi]